MKTAVAAPKFEEVSSIGTFPIISVALETIFDEH